MSCAPGGSIWVSTRTLCCFLLAAILGRATCDAVETYVVTWDQSNTNNQYLPVPEGLTNVVEVAAGVNFFAALHESGRVSAWGTNDLGQTDVPANLSDVTAIAAGSLHTVALKADGTVAAWGGNGSGQAAVPPGITNATGVGAFSRTSYASLADGRLVVWGLESKFVSWGALSNVCYLEDGLGSLISVSSEGVVSFWFDRLFLGGLPDLTGQSNVVTASTSGFSVTMLMRDGSVTNMSTQGFWGVLNSTSGFVQIADRSIRIALSRDGSAKVWPLRLPASAESLPLTNIAYIAAKGSPLAMIFAGGAPLWTVHPCSRSGYVGSTTRFEARASGMGTQFQWEKDGVELAGETNEFLELKALTFGSAGMYRARVWNEHGTALSRPAGLAVLDAAPEFVQQPASTNAAIGTQAELLARATGSLPQFFTWYSNGVPLLTNETELLKISQIKFSDAADYQVVVTNSLGSATSQVARVRVVNVYYYNYGVQSVPEDLTNAVQVAEGGRHAVALRADGTVRAWSWLNSMATITNVPAGLSNVVQITAGGAHTLALKDDGTVVSWGTDFYPNSGFIANAVPPEVTNVVSVAGGEDSSMALRADGTIVTWRGSLVVSTNLAMRSRVKIVAISGGSRGYMALHIDGTVTAWDRFGVLVSGPTGATNVVRVSVGPAGYAALRQDGTVVITDFSYVKQPVLTNMVGIAAGGSSSYQPSVLGWDSAGRVTNSVDPHYSWVVLPDTAAPVVEVSSWNGAVLLLATESVYMPTRLQRQIAYEGAPTRLYVPVVAPYGADLQWFNGDQPIPDATNRFLEVGNAQPGAQYTLVAQGPNGERASTEFKIEVSDSPPVFRFTSPATIGALKNDVELRGDAWGSGPMRYAWSRNGVRLPGQTNSVLRLTNLQYTDDGNYQLTATNTFGGLAFNPIRLRISPVLAWGAGAETNVPTGLRKVVKLTADTGVCVALHQDGHVTAWGDPASQSPGTPWWQGLSMQGVADVAVSRQGMVVLQTNGTVPGMPLTPNKAVAVAKGIAHSLALLPHGTVFAWGDNSAGQTNVPPGLECVISISARNNRNLALRSDGTVAAWGSNGYGESTVPAGLSNVVAMSAGDFDSLAVTADGRLVQWGHTNCSAAAYSAHNGNVLSASAGANLKAVLLEDGSVASAGCFGPPFPKVGAVGQVAAGGDAAFALIRDVPEPPVRIADVVFNDEEIVFQLPTELARSYIIERSVDLSGASWQVAGGVAGDGTTRALKISKRSLGAEFFRVRRN